MHRWEESLLGGRFALEAANNLGVTCGGPTPLLLLRQKRHLFCFVIRKGTFLKSSIGDSEAWLEPYPVESM